jgi:hypothetical protein
MIAFPSLKNRRKQQLRELLIAHADALVAGRLAPEQLLRPYDAETRSEVIELLALAERVSRALAEVSPSEQFVAQLRRQLVEIPVSERRSWWERIRQLPPRTQLAAGIGGATLTAGVVLIVSRSLPGALHYWRHRRVAA